MEVRDINEQDKRELRHKGMEEGSIRTEIKGNEEKEGERLNERGGSEGMEERQRKHE